MVPAGSASVPSAVQRGRCPSLTPHLQGGGLFCPQELEGLSGNLDTTGPFCFPWGCVFRGFLLWCSGFYFPTSIGGQLAPKLSNALESQRR